VAVSDRSFKVYILFIFFKRSSSRTLFDFISSIVFQYSITRFAGIFTANAVCIHENN
jgi:hypothetical protein